VEYPAVSPAAVIKITRRELVVDDQELLLRARVLLASPGIGEADAALVTSR
jgi:hypothetical protein